MNEAPTTREQAGDRLFQLELLAATDREAIPDHTGEILARAWTSGADASPGGPEDPARRFGRPGILVAVLMVLASLVVVAIASSRGGEEMVDTPIAPDAPPQDPTGMPPVPVRSEAEVRALPLGTQAVRGWFLDADAILALARLRGLRHLDLSLPQATPTPPEQRLDSVAIGHLGLLTSLESLVLDRQPEASRLTGLATLRRLRRLSLAGIAVDDHTLESVISLPALIDLNLEGCEGVTLAGMDAIVGMRRLRALSLRSVYGLPSVSLSRLGGLPRLQTLDLAGAESTSPLSMLRAGGGDRPGLGVNITVLVGLSKSPSLVDLNLDQCRNVHDSGVEHLSRCATLRRLSLVGTSVTAHGLRRLPTGLRHLQVGLVVGPEHLLRFEKLESLGLFHCPGLKVENILALLGTPLKTRLRRLAVVNCPGVDPSMPALLVGFPALIHLDLSHNRWFRGEQLGMLAPLAPRLRSLRLVHDTGLSAKDRERLAAFRALRDLYVEGIPAWSEAGMELVRKALPGLRIHPGE